MRVNEIRTEISKMIKELNTKKMVIFSLEDEDIEDNIYDYPYGFIVSKYGHYLQGNVSEINNGVASLVLGGEDFGDIITIHIEELPTETILELYELSEEQ